METTKWPAPKRPQPSPQTMTKWICDGVARATDGCRIEPDGSCQHGYPSWFIYLGVI